MRFIALALVSLLAVSAGYLVFRDCATKRGMSVQEVEVFNRWRREHGKLYSTPSESEYRMKVLVDNHHLVNKLNREYNELLINDGRPPLTGPMFALMSWSDLPIEEFTRTHTGVDLSDSEHQEVSSNDQAVEDESVQSIVMPSLGQTGSFTPGIRHQGSCGSCWAFSTIATLEKHHWVQTRQVIDFSQQQLVDCDLTNNGCSGGWMTKAIAHVVSKGIARQTAYPYAGVRKTCNINPSTQVASPNLAPVQVPYTSARAVQGVSLGLSMGTGVHVASNFYQLKGTQTYDVQLAAKDQCGATINHAVNIVGAGTETVNGVARNWISIQNSWGTGWGNAGHLRFYTCTDANKIWGTSNVIIHATATAKLA